MRPSCPGLDGTCDPARRAARTDEELETTIRDARARIAFYASTRGYRAAFSHLGLDDLAAEAALLARARRWDEMPALVSDDVLDRFAVIGTHDEIGTRLLERFGDLVTDVEFSIAVRDDTDRARPGRPRAHDPGARRHGGAPGHRRLTVSVGAACHTRPRPEEDT